MWKVWELRRPCPKAAQASHMERTHKETATWTAPSPPAISVRAPGLELRRPLEHRSFSSFRTCNEKNPETQLTDRKEALELWPLLSCLNHSTQPRTQLLWRRDKPLPLCSSWIPDPQYSEENSHYCMSLSVGEVFSTIIDNRNNLIHGSCLININLIEYYISQKFTLCKMLQKHMLKTGHRIICKLKIS